MIIRKTLKNVKHTHKWLYFLCYINKSAYICITKVIKTITKAKISNKIKKASDYGIT